MLPSYYIGLIVLKLHKTGRIGLELYEAEEADEPNLQILKPRSRVLSIQLKEGEFRMAKKKAVAKKKAAKKKAAPKKAAAKKKAAPKKAAAKKKAAPKKKAAAKKKAAPKKKAAAKKKAAPKKAAAKKKAAPKKKAAAKKKAAPKKKAAAKKKAAPKKKAAAKKKAKRKPNPAFMRPLQPDAALGAIVGNKPLPRTQITKKIWAYIKKNGLQDKKNKRMINADDKLRAVLGAKKIDMFKMTQQVNKHVE